MMEEPGRVGLGPAQSSSGTVGDSGWGPHGSETAPGDHHHQQRSDESGKLRAVMRDFGPAWEIERVPPGAAWVAVTRRGSWVHVIAAHDLDTLRTKIEAAERKKPRPGQPHPARNRRDQREETPPGGSLTPA